MTICWRDIAPQIGPVDRITEAEGGVDVAASSPTMKVDRPPPD